MAWTLKVDLPTLAALLHRLEHERSSPLCVQVAHALGYRMSGEPGSIQVDIPGSPFLSVYFSLDVLVDDLARACRMFLP